MSFVIFDLGGTNLRIGVSRDGSKVDDMKSVPTPPKFEDGVNTIDSVGKELLGGNTATAVAGGIGWSLDQSRSSIFNSTKKNLMDWSGKPLRDELAARFKAPATLYNDVALVGLGEAHSGAGKGSSILAYVTVSTGVNGVRIVDGKIDRATYGFETGKQIISAGKLEDLVSGTAVTKKFGIHPKDLDSLDERNKLGDLLAEGLFNTILHWSPDTIVLGGSMIIGKNPIPIPRVMESLARIQTIYPTTPRIVMAALGDNGGLEGARVLATMR
ncbi:MAG: glucokinase [Parcubacteria group bacterium Gr01-1014_8]|nr:MAG: glucokinase [Parcubacteria group bacterium Gr01-1014_8]